MISISEYNGDVIKNINDLLKNPYPRGSQEKDFIPLAVEVFFLKNKYVRRNDTAVAAEDRIPSMR